jgi:hypothetical protein
LHDGERDDEEQRAAVGAEELAQQADQHAGVLELIIRLVSQQ